MPLHIIRQDITKIRCDAIVNPTNPELIPGGGADEAIHTAAGPKLFEVCAKLGGCELGQAVITPAFDLPCKYVIHTVGPVWKDGTHGEKALLESCYTKSLQLAKEHKCKHIAFPLISSGTYGYPKDRVLKVAIDVIRQFLYDNEMTVTIAVFDKESFELSRELSDEVKAYIDDRYTGDDFPELTRKLRRINRFAAEEKRTKAVFTECETCSDESPVEAAFLPLAAAVTASIKKETLEDRLRKLDKGFAETLFDYIDAKGMDDVDCYKNANIDRKTFSKIRCNKNYKPSKQTALSFAIALHLTLDETNHLLSTVGMTLSHSSKFDVIVSYFIENGKYDIFEINETLFAFDQVLLGV